MSYIKKLRKYENQCIFSSVIMTALGLLLMVVAISMPNWLTLRYFRQQANTTYNISIHEHYGIWSYCHSEAVMVNGFVKNYMKNRCNRSDVLLSDDEYQRRYNVISKFEAVEDTNKAKDYLMSRAIFAVLAVIFIVIALLFAIFSYYYPRYTVKRVTAMMYVFAIIISLISVEIFREVRRDHKRHLELRKAQNISTQFGWSFYLNYIVSLLLIACCLIFIVFCPKAKYRDDYQPSQEIDQAKTDAEIQMN